MNKTYEQVHAGLLYVRGRASTHACECGAVARDWAYQHNAGSEELFSESGAPYSENLEEHYAPMCRACHSRLDWTTGYSGRLTLARQRNGKAVGEGFVEGKRLGGSRGAISTNSRFEQDPEFAQKCRVARSRNGNEALRDFNRTRYACECGRTMSKSNLGRHQSSTGCVGFNLENERAC